MQQLNCDSMAPADAERSVAGPLNAADAPWVDNPANPIGANAGQKELPSAAMRGADGQPLPDATPDFLRNGANGAHSRTTPLPAGAVWQARLGQLGTH